MMFGVNNSKNNTVVVFSVAYVFLAAAAAAEPARVRPLDRQAATEGLAAAVTARGKGTTYYCTVLPWYYCVSQKMCPCSFCVAVKRGHIFLLAQY